ncbi:unnamed protein product [Linum trigynum]|uniref:Uncharacterized protein n=1 Tax=Linum trigynum TaxID=586398 RepID=A0AAV2CC34_9ROSI
MASSIPLLASPIRDQAAPLSITLLSKLRYGIPTSSFFLFFLSPFAFFGRSGAVLVVLVTEFRLFFPQLILCGVDVWGIEEYEVRTFHS